MEHATGTLLVVLVIGALVGAGGTYYYTQGLTTKAFNDGMAYQQSITPQATVTAPDLTCALNVDDFDLVGAIDVNGDVVDDTPVTHTVTVTNNGDTAATVMMGLFNPTKNKYGLDSDLEIKYTHVAFDWNGMTNVAIYKDAVYADPFNLGTLPAGASVTFDVSIWFGLNTKGLYTAGTVYDCELYIYGLGASSVETLDFTVSI